MSAVYFVSDLHLGHKSVMRHTYKYREAGAYRGPYPTASVGEHDKWVLDQLLSVPADKRTVWWILGDVAMEVERLKLLNYVPGRKRLILGNHDLFQTQVYLKYFDWVGGTIRKYDMWLSHFPIHPAELYGWPNIHGHSHSQAVAGTEYEDWYLNACIEWLPSNKPLSLEEVRAYWDERLEEAE